jgi:hypothetical protein
MFNRYLTLTARCDEKYEAAKTVASHRPVRPGPLGSLLSLSDPNVTITDIAPDALMWINVSTVLLCRIALAGTADIVARSHIVASFALAAKGVGEF